MQKFASGKFAIAICDICGFQYKLNELKYVPYSALGSPVEGLTNLKACPKCWDAPHPQSSLPKVAAMHGADAQQLRDPRPDTQAVVYQVAFQPGVIAHGSTTLVSAVGVFSGYSAVASVNNPSIVISSCVLLSPTRALLTMAVDPSASAGIYTVSIQDSQVTLQGLISVS